MRMSRRSGWKKAERRIARELGGDRSTSPLQNSKRGTNADAIGIPEYLEVKNPKSDSTHDSLSELHGQAKRYDRIPVLYCENVGSDPVTFLAMWLEHYSELRDPDDPGNVRRSFERGVIPVPSQYESYLFQHEVGKRIANSALMRDTIKKAESEEREPLVVIQRKNSPKKATLIPIMGEVDSNGD